MKSSAFKRKALAAALFAASGIASASSYFIVVPVAGKTLLLAGINVALNSYAPPAGIVGVAYDAFDFTRLLSVTGDPDFSLSRVSWSVSNGALPPGLTLSRDGRLSGTLPRRATARSCSGRCTRPGLASKATWSRSPT